MGWFSKRRDDGPSLHEAWRLLGGRLGLEVEQDGEMSVHVSGPFRGHVLDVSIEGRRRGSELLQSFAPTHRKRVHQIWRTDVRVRCANPAGLVGAVLAFTDLSDPAWDPRNFDASHCRVVRLEPASLPASLVAGSISDRLTSVRGDLRIEVGPDGLRMAEEKTSSTDGGYFVGSFLHSDHPLPPQPWPDRALIGPMWWMDLLGDLADRVAGAGPD